MLLPAVMARRAARSHGAAEAVLLGPGGEVREGAASNVLLVEGRDLVTPEQTHHLLPGLTRPVVEGLAAEAGMALHAEPVSLDRLRAADEVLVTSTTFLLMPITRLDGARVGGRESAGPVSRDLARRLRDRLRLPEAYM